MPESARAPSRKRFDTSTTRDAPNMDSRNSARPSSELGTKPKTIAKRPPLASTLHAAGVPKLYDPGFATTVACTSSITFLDGPAGILRYRGYPIEQLASKTSFDEIAYLLLDKSLPTRQQLDAFRTSLASKKVSSLPNTVAKVIQAFPSDTHPMTILVSSLAALAAEHPQLNPSVMTGDVYDSSSVRSDVVCIVLGVLPTLAGAILHHTSGISMRQSKSQPVSVVRESYETWSTPPSYTRRFLDNLNPSLHPQLVSALDTLLILHADHEQNCSTSAVRHLSSSGVDVFSSLSAGAAALYGPLHGGACEAVVRMLTRIGSPENAAGFLEGVKSKKEKLMGFGHRVYKTYDPRARIVRKLAQNAVDQAGVKSDALIEVAYELERIALSDDYFVSRKLYPNVDFYSGIIYRAMGIEPPFFTVIFSLGRMAGWLAHWIEFLDDPDRKIARPHQHYTGTLGPLPVPSIDNRESGEAWKSKVSARL